MTEVGIERTILLRHKDDVVDCGDIARRVVIVVIIIVVICSSVGTAHRAPGHEQRQNCCCHYTAPLLNPSSYHNYPLVTTPLRVSDESSIAGVGSRSSEKISS